MIILSEVVAVMFWSLLFALVAVASKRRQVR